MWKDSAGLKSVPLKTCPDLYKQGLIHTSFTLFVENAEYCIVWSCCVLKIKGHSYVCTVVTLLKTRGTGWGPNLLPSLPPLFFLGFLPLGLFRSRNVKHCCVTIPPPPPLIYPLHTFLWTTINSIINNFATLRSKTLGTTLGGRSDGCPQIMEYTSSLSLLKHIFCLTTRLFAFFMALVLNNKRLIKE